MINVLVNGAGGRMGSEVVRAVHAEKDMTVVAAVDPGHAGEDIGQVTGLGNLGITIAPDLETGLANAKVDVVVDFTNPSVIFENARKVVSKGVHMVIGTTGLTAEQREELSEMAAKTGSHILIAPNFCMGAVLLMKVSEEIARYMPDVEIIELHHNHKYDAPSGTAKLTAEKIARARQTAPAEDMTRESLPGVRGGKYEGVTIHSVRLPGYVAHQEVLFGGYGETLTLRHDSLNRQSFMPGVILAVRKVSDHPGLTYGLENYLE